MVRGLIISLLLSLGITAQAQILQGVTLVQPGVSGVTAGLVNLHAGSSTGTNAIAAQVAGTSTCAANAYCTSLTDASVSGNTIVVAYVYTSTNTTAHAPTVTDDKGGGSSTYTCVTEGNDANVTTRTFAGWCYSFNVASGIRKITVTWPVATMTHGQAAVFQLYNVVTGDTLSAANGTQTPSTTYTSGAITTTVDGDLVCNLVVGTTTRRNLGTSFTAGSGFSLYVAERLDGFAVECGVQSTHGSITPSMTGLSNTYVAVDISFKAGTSGTAPSGMHVIAEQHESTDTATTGTFTLQMPSAGANLLAVGLSCGGTGPMAITAISDGTNTWRKAAARDVVGDGTGGLLNLWYAENVTGSATNVNTYTTTGTGDCSFWTWAIAGAAVHPYMAHMDECSSGSTAYSPGASPFCADGQTNGTIIAASTFSPFSTSHGAGFFPGSNNGISIFTNGLASNTAISMTAPSGEAFDSDTSGGESLSGPWPVDENNGLSHLMHSNNNAQTVTIGLTSSSTSVGQFTAARDSFAASGATLLPSLVDSTSCVSQAAGGTNSTTTCDYTPHNTGNTLAIILASGATSGTISLTDSAGNTLVKGFPTSGNCTNVTNGCFQTYYVASANATSSDTFTATWSASTSYRTIYILEMRLPTGALDQATNGTTSSGTAGATNSVSVTTTHANEILIGANLCSAECNPGATANEGRMDNTGSTGQGQQSLWKILTGTGAATLAFVETSGSGHTEGSAVMSFF